jgi:flagellar M-ring protein FliF
MVERFRGFLNQFSSQAKVFYSGLTKGRKIALGATASIVLVGLMMLAVWRPERQYETVYVNLAQEDKTAILKFLRQNNVKDFKMDGDSLAFPSEEALDVKMRLAEEGLPNSGVGVGWEKFDERAFGMTDFDQRINKLRAVQGEISRTINKLEPVAGSRVHIVMPDKVIFADEKRPTTASVSLKLKSGKSLSQQQVQGILHLTARAVEGLDPKNITIVDQAGNLLTRPDEEDGGIDRVTSSQREYQRRVEREFEGKIQEILTRVVGHDKVVAKVQADVEFKKVETTIQDVDPERTAVVSSQRSEQSTDGSGFNPTGVPGAKSNLPGEREDAAGGGSSTSSKSNAETLNFEVKKTLSRIVEPIGTVKKTSTAVLVDGKMVNGQYAQRTPEDLAMITNLVKNAIGFQEGRDSITVENAQFELDAFALAEQQSLTQRKTSLIQTGIIASVSIAAMFFLYFALLKPYFRWLTFDPDKRSAEGFAVVDYELERTGSASKRVQVAEEVPFEKLSPKEQILYLAKHDPKKTTEALRQLLSPNQSG